MRIVVKSEYIPNVILPNINHTLDKIRNNRYYNYKLIRSRYLYLFYIIYYIKYDAYLPVLVMIISVPSS